MVDSEDFLMFQFEVDNAATIERGVALLLSKLPTHLPWILTYLYISPHNTVAREFVHAFVRRAGPQDIPLLRDVLAAAGIPFTLRLLLASPCPEISAILVEWYQKPWQFFAHAV